MGDTKDEDYRPFLEEPYLEALDKEGYRYDEAEMPSEFAAEIISWEYPEPIENSLKFVGFTRLHAVSMFAMLLVAVLTIIACVIFVKKNDGVSYNLLDRLSVVVNFLIVFLVIPFITIVIAFLPITMDPEDLVYQIYLCIPTLTAFTIAASVALRRKGFAKSGLLVQLACPVLFFGSIIIESLIYNLFL
jgi:hypothetical protein